MRLGINTLAMIPGAGALETLLRQTVPRMAALYPEHEFFVFGNAENRLLWTDSLRDHPNVTLLATRVRAFAPGRRRLYEQLRLPGALRRSGVDVLWSVGGSTPCRSPCPRLVTVLDLAPLCCPGDYAPGVLRIERLLLRAALRRGDCLAAVSEFCRQEILRHARVPFDRIHVTPLAADPAFAEPVPGTFLADRVMTLLHGADPYVLCVGDSVPHKRLDLVVEAFGALSEEIPHRLVLIGQPGRGEERLLDAIERLPDRGRVVRLRHVERRDLVALFQAADALVSASEHEGFGLAVIEAMLAGLPVLAAGAGAVPEVGANTVRSVPSGDPRAMAEALRQTLFMPQDQRAAQTAAAKARAANYSWDTTAHTTLQAALRILGQPATAPAAAESEPA